MICFVSINPFRIPICERFRRFAFQTTSIIKGKHEKYKTEQWYIRDEAGTGKYMMQILICMQISWKFSLSKTNLYSVEDVKVHACCMYIRECMRVVNIDSHTHTDTESDPIVLTNTVNTCDVCMLRGSVHNWAATNYDALLVRFSYMQKDESHFYNSTNGYTTQFR